MDTLIGSLLASGALGASCEPHPQPWWRQGRQDRAVPGRPIWPPKGPAEPPVRPKDWSLLAQAPSSQVPKQHTLLPRARPTPPGPTAPPVSPPVPELCQANIQSALGSGSSDPHMIMWLQGHQKIWAPLASFTMTRSGTHVHRRIHTHIHVGQAGLVSSLPGSVPRKY